MQTDIDRTKLQEQSNIAILDELQTIFAQLQESEKQYYAPSGFTRVF